MLLRPQALWLVLSVLAGVASFEFPFAISPNTSSPTSWEHVDAGSSMILIVLTGISVAWSAVTMLSYTNLVKQKTLCRIGIIIGIALLLAFIREWKSAPQAEFTMTSILPLLNPIFLWLALQAIDNDQKILKKMGKRKDS